MAGDDVLNRPELRATPVLLELSQAARRWAETADQDTVLHDIIHTCRRMVPCHSAAIALTSQTPDRRPVRVRAATHPDEFDTLLGIVARVPGSPGVSAAEAMATVRSQDLTAEDRPEYREYANLVLQRTPIRATAAFALKLRSELVGVLNVYFTNPDDFDETVDARAAAIADHAAVVIGSRAAEQRADQLQTALTSSRVIGPAIGILVERHRVPDDAAFAMLRDVSMNTNRKLFAIAERLVLTGEL